LQSFLNYLDDHLREVPLSARHREVIDARGAALAEALTDYQQFQREESTSDVE
jgi:hypothetical protein